MGGAGIWLAPFLFAVTSGVRGRDAHATAGGTPALQVRAGGTGGYGVIGRNHLGIEVRHPSWPEVVAMGLYSHYDSSHTHPANRALHMIAIPVGFSSVFFLRRRPRLALALIPSAFGLAWLGHLIEGNKPAFLGNPTHVLVAPVWMARRMFGKREPVGEADRGRTHRTMSQSA